MKSRRKKAERTASLPCLKWPGGKQWLAPRLVPILKKELQGVYREPFVGGGAVFFQLAPAKAFLSDVNAELVRFLCCLADDPETIANAVWRFSNTRDCYNSVRKSKPTTPFGAAARFIYLNRTCWGGVYRTNLSGEFNVPFGDSGRTICRRKPLMACSKLLKGVQIRPLDFGDAIAKAEAGDVVYADPPYTTRGENNGFVRYNEKLFSWDDQVRLSECCRQAKRRGVFVAVSGLWHEEVLSLYKGWWAWKLERQSDISRTVSSRGMVHEAVIFSRKPKAAGRETTLVRIA